MLRIVTHAERLRAQLLSGPPASDPVAVCERLLAVQGQDPRGFRLAVRARTRGLTVADVERALGERELVVTWLNRGTLHLVRSEDYPWLHALTAPQQLTGIMRRLSEQGVGAEAADRGVDAIVAAIADEGPLTRATVRERIAAVVGVGTEGQVPIHVLALASLRGLVVRGPMIGKQHAYVLVRDWLGKSKPVDRDAALAELARRYLAGHGPADDRDLAKWAGITLSDARAGLAAAAPVRARRARELPPPKLLGSFDPVLLGWASRDDVTGPHADRLVAGGIFRPFALVDGRAAATWTLRGGKVEIEPFAKLPRTVAAALEEEAADVVRFLQAERSSTPVA